MEERAKAIDEVKKELKENETERLDKAKAQLIDTSKGDTVDS